MYGVENFEMGRVFWIFQVGPKCNHKGPRKKEARSQEEKEADDRRRGWSDVARKGKQWIVPPWRV